ncbi:hypothetical protein Ancab_025064 [Ancistrocladus abbreviatus]
MNVLYGKSIRGLYLSSSRQSREKWSAPLVVAHGGFSGLFPDSSLNAFSFALTVSLSNVILWCDVQLTKDGTGICFPDLRLENSSDVATVVKSRQSTYVVNGVPLQVTQGIFSRDARFDGAFRVEASEAMFNSLQSKPPSFWLNIQV